MIEHLSSNNFSSQLRSTNNDGIKGNNNPSIFSGNTNSENKSNIKMQSNERIVEVVESLNQFLQPTHTSLRFQFHEKLNEYYVAVVDDKTKEVVREIPPKKLLDFYAAMTDFLGLMVDKKI